MRSPARRAVAAAGLGLVVVLGAGCSSDGPSGEATGDPGVGVDDPDAFCSTMREVSRRWEAQADTSLAADPDAFDAYVDTELEVLLADLDDAASAAPALADDVRLVRDEAEAFYRDAAAWIRDPQDGPVPTFDLEVGEAQRRIDAVVEPTCGFTVWF